MDHPDLTVSNFMENYIEHSLKGYSPVTILCLDSVSSPSNVPSFVPEKKTIKLYFIIVTHLSG